MILEAADQPNINKRPGVKFGKMCPKSCRCMALLLSLPMIPAKFSRIRIKACGAFPLSSLGAAFSHLLIASRFLPCLPSLSVHDWTETHENSGMLMELVILLPKSLLIKKIFNNCHWELLGYISSSYYEGILSRSYFHFGLHQKLWPNYFS